MATASTSQHVFRQRWYLISIGLASLGGLVLVVAHRHLSPLRILLGASLLSLFVHQFEEYQWPGYFPRMINTVMFASKQPDRYPLNATTAWIINVWLGWVLYALAFVFADTAMWLATASIMVSAGNVVAHTVLFNAKGKTHYNPGMVTAIVLFLPITVYYFVFSAQHNLLHPVSLGVGIVLGLLINYFGVFKMITLLSTKKSPLAFTPFH
ncbi:MAG TPA: HXXEE domain-containing protein [Candidatus Saccharimonadales bacterium]|nr:HXXEE domain-containing protein [Candidatus Saccharimonadales bacterium]